MLPSTLEKTFDAAACRAILASILPKLTATSPKVSSAPKAHSTAASVRPSYSEPKAVCIWPATFMACSW
ncbi:hypothetical protein D3C76_1295120 [compost metagenome]